MNLKFWNRRPDLDFSANFTPKKSVLWKSIRKVGHGVHDIIATIVAVVSAIVANIVPSAVGITAYWVATSIVYAAIACLVVGSVWYTLSGSQKAKKSGQSRDFKDSGHLLNTKSTSEPLPILYGTCRMGGNIVYLNCTGTDNEYVHMILTFSEGPIAGLNSDGTGDIIWLDDKRIQEFAGLYYYEFFAGAGDQNVCTTLHEADPNWNDALRYTSYLYLRLKYDGDKFLSFPNVTAELMGRTLYDPRDESTSFSANNALVAFDFLRSDRYSIGLPLSVFDLDSVIDSANWCDTNSYTFNGPIMDRQPVIDNSEDILKNFRAGLVWSEGTYKLIVYDYDTPVMSLTEDDIDRDSFRIVVPGIPETPNRIIVAYIDAVDNYISKTRVIEDTDAVLTYDLEERDFDLELKGITSAEQATKLGAYWLDRSRLNYQFSFVCHPRAVALDPMDMIEVTHSLPGWTDKVLRVLDSTLTQDGRVKLLCINESSDLYDDTVNVATHNAYETNLPSPTEVPPNVINVVITEELYGTKNNILTKLLVDFNPPGTYPFLDYAEIWISTDGSTYSLYLARSGTHAEILRVDEQITYYIKIVPVNLLGTKRALADSTAYSHFVVGKSEVPDDIVSFWATVSSEGVFLNWLESDEVDIDHYEIRWSSDIAASWATAFTICSGTKGDKLWLPAARSGRYFIKAVDTTGNTSASAAYFDLEVSGLIKWNEIVEMVEDPTFPGAKNNMTVSANNLYLDSGNSTGYYYSNNSQDLGIVSTARCSLDMVAYGINIAVNWDSITNFDLYENIDGDVSQITIIPQIATSQDGNNFAGWTNFFVGSYRAREFKFRVIAASTNNDQRICIEHLSFFVDMADREEYAKGVAISSAGNTIAFTDPFQIAPRMWITIQNATQGDYYDLSEVTTDDFTVTIKASNGVGKNATIDWQAGAY